MTLLLAIEASDEREVAFHRCSKGNIPALRSFGCRNQPKLACFLVEEPGDNILEGKVGRRGRVEGDKKIVIGGGETTGEDQNNVFIINCDTNVLQLIGETACLGNEGLNTEFTLFKLPKLAPHSESCRHATCLMHGSKVFPNNVRIIVLNEWELGGFHMENDLCSSLGLAFAKCTNRLGVGGTTRESLITRDNFPEALADKKGFNQLLPSAVVRVVELFKARIGFVSVPHSSGSKSRRGKNAIGEIRPSWQYNSNQTIRRQGIRPPRVARLRSSTPMNRDRFTD